MSFQIPDESTWNRAEKDYSSFLMKILHYKILLHTILWYSCIGFAIPMVLSIEGYDPAIGIMWFFIGFGLCYVLIEACSIPIMKWYYPALCENHWWSLGDDVIFVHQGIFTKQLARIPYERIQNLNTKSGWWDRQGGFYKIEIETAGRGGLVAEGVIFGIKTPEDIIAKIEAKMKKRMVKTEGVPLESTVNKGDKGEIIKSLERVDVFINLLEKLDILDKINQKLESIENLLRENLKR